ncbi:hypothetical protein QE373_001326 [Stenotrophomonas sp. SORGH_AS321]|nr:hypothetical protein [Stenotrophomonas sp. SORGH_AS_0321]
MTYIHPNDLVSEADAMAEGGVGIFGCFTQNGGKYECRSPRGAFVQR